MLFRLTAFLRFACLMPMSNFPVQDILSLSKDQTRCLVEARRQYLMAAQHLKHEQLALLGPLQVCSVPVQPYLQGRSPAPITKFLQTDTSFPKM